MSILTKLKLKPLTEHRADRFPDVRVAIQPPRSGRKGGSARLDVTFSRAIGEQLGVDGANDALVAVYYDAPHIVICAPEVGVKIAGAAAKTYRVGTRNSATQAALHFACLLPPMCVTEQRKAAPPVRHAIEQKALVVQLPDDFLLPSERPEIAMDERVSALPCQEPEPPAPPQVADEQVEPATPVTAAPVYRLEQPFDDAKVPSGIEAQYQGPVFPDVEPAPAPGNGSAFTETVMSVIEAASLATGEPPEAITGSSIALLPRIGRLAAVLLLSERGISHDVIGRHFGGRADVKVASLLEAAERSKGTAEFDDCLRKMRAILNGEEVAPVSERGGEEVDGAATASPLPAPIQPARHITEVAQRVLEVITTFAEGAEVLPPNKGIGDRIGKHEVVVSTALAELEEAGRIRRVFVNRDGVEHSTHAKGRARVITIVSSGKSTANPFLVSSAEEPKAAQKRDLPVLPARGRALSPAEAEMQEVMRGGPAAAAGGVEADFQFLVDKKVAVTRNPGDKTRPFKMNGRPITADDVSTSAARLRQITEGR